MNVVVIVTLALVAAIEGSHFAPVDSVYRTAFAAAPFYERAVIPEVAAVVPEVPAARFDYVTDHARSSVLAGATADAAATIGSGYPYVDYYKSIADYYAAAPDHTYARSYVGPHYAQPSRFFYPY